LIVSQKEVEMKLDDLKRPHRGQIGFYSTCWMVIPPAIISPGNGWPAHLATNPISTTVKTLKSSQTAFIVASALFMASVTLKAAILI